VGKKGNFVTAEKLKRRGKREGEDGMTSNPDSVFLFP